MAPLVSTLELRVRYSETDRMGSFYNSRSLEWFECGRTEWLRQTGLGYADIEQRGAFLPLVEAHVLYHARARYDDLLTVRTTAAMAGRARLRFDLRISQPDGMLVTSGYTVHAVTDAAGKAMRPPSWLVEVMQRHGSVATEQPE